MTDQQAGLTQKDRRITITTVLDQNKQPGEDDPLLPAIAQCSEAISAPYYIDLLMYGKKGLNIKPNQLINTPATVSFRVENFVQTIRKMRQLITHTSCARVSSRLSSGRRVFIAGSDSTITMSMSTQPALCLHS